MTNPTLGERLARNLAQEQSRSIQAQQAAAQHTSAEALREFEQVAQFFEQAKVFFTEGIENQTPSAKLRIQVGRSGPGSEGSCNGAMYGVLKGWDYRDGQILSLHGKGRFAPLWTAFQQWAQSQGLKACWQYAHDSGGMESWWYLRVELGSGTVVKPQAIPGNDVRLSHPYSLHVLSSTLHAYLKVVDALKSSSATHPEKRILVEQKDLIAVSRALHADLLGS